MSETLKKMIEGYKLLKEDHRNSSAITEFLDRQIKNCEEIIERGDNRGET